jgi:hypothetical protein
MEAGEVERGRGARIVVLTAGGPLAWSVVNGLSARLGPLTVIEEQPETKGEIIRRRLRLVGPVTTAGQIAFGVWQRLTARRAESRLGKIREVHGLDPQMPKDIPVHRVGSLNSEQARALQDALSGTYETMTVNLPSQNHLPPTIWAYFWNGLTKGVW